MDDLFRIRFLKKDAFRKPVEFISISCQRSRTFTNTFFHVEPATAYCCAYLVKGSINIFYSLFYS